MMKMDYDGREGPITIQYNSYDDGSKVSAPAWLVWDAAARREESAPVWLALSMSAAWGSAG